MDREMSDKKHKILDKEIVTSGDLLISICEEKRVLSFSEFQGKHHGSLLKRQQIKKLKRWCEEILENSK